MERRTAKGLLWVGVGFTLSFALLHLFLGTWLIGTAVTPVLLAVSCFLPAEILRRKGALDQVQWLVSASAALAVVSVATGFMNGATDEGPTTALYAGLFPHLYSTPLIHTYPQYGQTLLETAYYSYLPLLAFLAIPGTANDWIVVACWVGILFLLRDRPYALAVLGAPYLGLMAANGFNDFIPLLLLTFAYTYRAHPRWGRVGEIVAMGTKQFAVAISVLFHVAQKQWKWAGVSLLATAAFLLPFVYWDGAMNVWCHAVISDSSVPSGCTSRGVWNALTGHLNYWFYPVWAAVVFAPPFFAWTRREEWEPYRREATSILGSARRYLPAEAILVGAWLLWWVEWPRRRLGRFFRFCLVGLTGVGVNLAVFLLALDLLPSGLTYVFVASTAAFLVATTSNFTLNYHWTFRDRLQWEIHHHWALYVVLSLVSFAANEVVLYLLLGHVSSLYAQVAGVGVSCVVGYTTNARLNFPEPAPPRPEV